MLCGTGRSQEQREKHQATDGLTGAIDPLNAHASALLAQTFFRRSSESTPEDITTGAGGVGPEPDNHPKFLDTITESPQPDGQSAPDPDRESQGRFKRIFTFAFWRDQLIAAGGIAADAVAMVAALTLRGTPNKILMALCIGIGLTHAIEPTLGFWAGFGAGQYPLILGSLNLAGALVMTKFLAGVIKKESGLSADQEGLDVTQLEAISQRMARFGDNTQLSGMQGLKQIGILMGLLAPMIQSVSNDALVSGFGKIPAVEGFSMPEFLIANAVVGLSVFFSVQGARVVTRQWRDHKVSRAAATTENESDSINPAAEPHAQQFARWLCRTVDLEVGAFSYFALRSAISCGEIAMNASNSPALSKAAGYLANYGTAGALLGGLATIAAVRWNLGKQILREKLVEAKERIAEWRDRPAVQESGGA